MPTQGALPHPQESSPLNASKDALPGFGSINTFAKALLPYRKPSGKRGVFEILVTIGPLMAIAALAFLALRHHFLWGLALVAPAAAFLVRLFMIQHDCGHGAFFASKRMNDWLGRIIGVMTLTPYDYWRHTHAVQHATSGALHRRSLGGVELLTVTEYRALSGLRRLGYWLYRHPVVLFGLGPAYMFLLQHRLPIGMMRYGWKPWVSVQMTNVGVVILSTTLIWIFGLPAFLFVYIPAMTLAASIGVWLFFVQHQFEDTYWAQSDEWDFNAAALLGSSHYDLPPILRWFTANIGIHHVHHLNSRIPFYRLGQVLRDEPALRNVSRLTLWQSLRCAKLALWDEAGSRLISFGELRRLERMASLAV